VQVDTVSAGLLRVTAFETRYGPDRLDGLRQRPLPGAERQQGQGAGDRGIVARHLWGTDLRQRDVPESVDETNNTQLLRRARRHASFDVGRNFGNWRFGGEWLVSSERLDNSGRVLGGYGIVNLNARYNIDKQWFVAARVENLFDKNYQLAYPTTRRAGPGSSRSAGARSKA
jgi:vitamin B12 transporter